MHAAQQPPLGTFLMGTPVQALLHRDPPGAGGQETRPLVPQEQPQQRKPEVVPQRQAHSSRPQPIETNTHSHREPVAHVQGAGCREESAGPSPWQSGPKATRHVEAEAGQATHHSDSEAQPTHVT